MRFLRGRGNCWRPNLADDALKKRPMKIKLVALDIDGTLLDKQGELPPANVVAIQKVIGQGVKVILVTGRRLSTARQISEAIGIPFPMVVHNGALICPVDGSAPLAKQLLPPLEALEILAATRLFLSDVVLHLIDQGLGKMVVHPSHVDNAVLARYLAKNQQQYTAAEKLEACISDNLIQIMFAGTLQRLSEIEATLKEAKVLDQVNVAKTCYADRDFGIVDILGKRCCKRQALEFLANFYGCSQEEILAIGDNHNDLDMLEYAGTSIIMANCAADLRNRKFIETSSNEEAGVAQALEQFVLRKCEN
jgi:Cof subfamily protein (haloacid dehalogenase superfamily)